MNRTTTMKSTWLRLSLFAAMALLVLVMGFVLTTESAFAQTNTSGAIGQCVDASNGLDNNCTANDVDIAQFDIIGAPVTECFAGETINLTLQARVVANSNERYDIGLYVGLNGANAKTAPGANSCYRDFLSPNSGTPNLSSGYGPFRELETGGNADSCGDALQNEVNLKVLQPFSLTCEDGDNDGLLDVSACTSWDNTRNNTCTQVLDTTPNTRSKCFCDTVQVGQVLVRRFANIEIVKDVVSPFPTDSGRFNLLADGTVRLADAYDVNMATGSTDDPNVSGTQNSTGVFRVQVGTSNQTPPIQRTIAIAEQAGAGTNLANYTSSIVCINTGTNVEVARNNNGTSVNLNAVADGNYRCTVTNTRRSGSIQLVKDFVGNTGGASVSLSLGANVVAANLTADGQSAVIPVAPGQYTVSESFTAGNAGDFTTTVACSNATGVTGSGLSRTLTVPENANVICTFTNTRNTAQLRIVKDVNGPANTANSNWAFNVTGPTAGPRNLSVNGTGQSDTGYFTVDTGSYAITESGASGTNLSLFNSTASCVGATTNGTAGANGQSVSGIAIGSGQQVTCTFVNTRQQGTLEVRKELTSTRELERFGLSIDGVASVSNQGDGGTTGVQTVATGVYNISESGNLGLFNTRLSCVDTSVTPAVPATFTAGSANQSGSVTVGEGQQIVCTFNNQRIKADVRLIKRVVSPLGAQDPGRFNLQIETVTVAENVGDGGDSGLVGVEVGVFGVSETAGEDTNLDDYNTSIACVNAASETVASNSGETSLSGIPLTVGGQVTCTITNTRRSGTIQIVKRSLGGVDTFDYTTTGSGLQDFSLTTTEPTREVSRTFTLPTGDYTITEEAQTLPWDFTSLECQAGPGSTQQVSGQTATLTLGSDSSILCTYTNTRRGSLIVTKTVDWNGTVPVEGQTYTLCVEGPLPNQGADYRTCLTQEGTDAPFIFNNLIPGAYNVFESSKGAANGWFMAALEGSATVNPGDETPVTVNNKRIIGSFLIEKTIAGEWTQPYTWEIVKSVDPATIDLFDGDSREVTYTVEATRTELTPIDLFVTGEVRVTNQSTQTAAIVQDVEDILNGVGAVNLSCDTLRTYDGDDNPIDAPSGWSSFPFAIPAEATLVCAYREPVPSIADYTNSVTVTLANGTEYTKSVMLADWGNPTETISDTIQLDDPKLPLLGGTFSGTDSKQTSTELSCADGGELEYTNNFASFTYTNTISVVGSNPVQEDSAEVEVNCYRLAVQKTGVPTYTLTYDWEIEKSVSPTSLTLAAGQTGTLTYTLDLTKDEGTPSAFAAAGLVTISNPAPMAATLDAAPQDLLAGQSVALDCGGSTTVLANDSLTCSYAALVSNVTPTSTITNVASAVLFGKVYTDEIDIDFGAIEPTKINNSITISDLFTDTAATSIAVTGTRSFGPFTASGPYKYEGTASCVNRIYEGVGTLAVDIDNTATIVELPTKSSSASVDLTCVPPGKVIVNKQVLGATTWSFDFNLAGVGNRTVTQANPSAEWAGLLPNQSYSLTEVDPGAAWQVGEFSCVDGENNPLADADPNTAGVQFEVRPNETVTCAITNERAGSVTVTKLVQPASYSEPWSFTFRINEVGGAFTDDQVVDNDNPVATWSDLLPGTRYALTELDPGAGWSRGDFVCLRNGNPIESLDPDAAGFVLEIQPGDSLACSMTNERLAQIIVEKQTIPDGETTTFGFTNGFGAQGFPKALADGETDSIFVDPGTYVITETASAGWDLTNISCTVLVENSNASGGRVGETSSAQYIVGAGDVVKCVFENTQRGNIIIEKQTEPADSTQPFTFTPSYNGGATFSLTDNQTNNSGLIPPGSYSVVEQLPPGWRQTNSFCSDEVSTLDDITLTAGDTITCTVYNRQDGVIIVQKVTDPAGDPQKFEFTGDLTGSIGHGENLSATVPAGLYSVTEVVPQSGWRLTDISCDEPVLREPAFAPLSTDNGDDNGVSVANTAFFDVQPGETVTCTFTNTKLSRLGDRLWFDTDNDGQQEGGEAGVNGVTVNLYRASAPTVAISTTTTAGDGNYSFNDLLPDTYIVEFVSPPAPFVSKDQGADATDSDVYPNTGRTDPIVLPAGTTDIIEDAGIYTPAVITVDKVASGNSFPQPGANVIFTFTVTNTSPVARVTINELVDTVFGNLNGQGTCSVPQGPLNPGESYECSITEPFFLADDDTQPINHSNTVTARGVSEFNQPVEDSDDESLVVLCQGQTVEGTVFADFLNVNNILDAGEFPWSLEPTLIPAQQIELPLTLEIRNKLTSEILETLVTVTADGFFRFTNVPLPTAIPDGLTYTLRVGDQALRSFGYLPTDSSLDFDVLPLACKPYVKDFGYSPTENGLIGDFFWYDVNVNNKQDEWFDANGDGQITENVAGQFSLSEWEFVDLDGSGTANLPEELNSCGINTVGPNVNLVGEDGGSRDRIAGNTGYYAHTNTRLVVQGQTITTPLDPQGTYTATISATDPKLVEGSIFWFAKRGDAARCKPLPVSPIVPQFPSGGDPLPLIINIDDDGNATAASAAAAAVGAAAVNGEAAPAPECGITSGAQQVVDLSQTPNGIYLDADFAAVCTASTAGVGNRVWLDTNPGGGSSEAVKQGNGLQDAGEVGVQGITVQLWSVGANGNAEDGAGDDVLAGTRTTDAQGLYNFAGVAPGRYYVVFIHNVPGRAWVSFPNAGADDAIDSDGVIDPNNANRAVTAPFDLADGQVDDTWDAGLIDTSATGSSDLGDRVWFDQNRNGVQDEGEVGRQGIVVELYRLDTPADASVAAETLVGTQTTDVNGLYRFTALDPGQYVIKFTIPTALVTIKDAGSNNGADSDIAPNGRTDTITLAAFTSDLTWDAGITPSTPTSDEPEGEPNLGQFRIFLPSVNK